MLETQVLIPGSGRFPWNRKWQPIPVFLPGKFHGQRSLVGYIHGVTKHWTWLKRLSTAQHSTIIALLMVKDREAWCAAVQFQFQFSRSVVSDSLRPDEPQHTRPPCPSPTPRVYSDSCPLSWWCHQIVSYSVISFSSCPQSFPASGSFQMSQLFAWGGQSIGVSASASVHSNEYSGLISFRRHWLDLPAVQGTRKSLLQHHNFSALSFLYSPTLTSIHVYWKNHSFD